MRCNRGPCDKPATRNVLLTSRYVQIVREFCDDCTRELCADPPLAGVTSTATGVRDPLVGTDLGPIESN